VLFRSRLLACLCLGLTLAALPAHAQERVGAASAAAPSAAQQSVKRQSVTGLPLPRFVSLRASEVNLRTGPGVRYPIDWVYHRRNLPVEIIDEFETWRRIRDWEGTVGWVHQSMLQGRRTLLVLAQERLLQREPGEASAAVARLEAGALGVLEGCQAGWCRTNFGGFEGWLPRAAFYGAYADDDGR
jgi:SH3-like domain-containing protein